MEELGEIAAAIASRWELALYADDLVETFDLAMPGGKTCILWDSKKGRFEAEDYDQYSVIFRRLVKGEFPPVPADTKDPRSTDSYGIWSPRLQSRICLRMRPQH